MCVLRERGQHEEAEQLRLGSVAEMVAALRTPEDTDASIRARLDEIFATETERVANAAVLAELLAPLLSERMGAVALPKATTVSASAPAPLNPAPAKPSSPPRAAAVSIADFIDEMIAQEKPPERPRETARRAS